MSRDISLFFFLKGMDKILESLSPGKEDLGAGFFDFSHERKTRNTKDMSCLESKDF